MRRTGGSALDRRVHRASWLLVRIGEIQRQCWHPHKPGTVTVANKSSDDLLRGPLGTTSTRHPSSGRRVLRLAHPTLWGVRLFQRPFCSPRPGTADNKTALDHSPGPPRIQESGPIGSNWFPQGRSKRLTRPLPYPGAGKLILARGLHPDRLAPSELPALMATGSASVGGHVRLHNRWSAIFDAHRLFGHKNGLETQIAPVAGR